MNDDDDEGSEDSPEKWLVFYWVFFKRYAEETLSMKQQTLTRHQLMQEEGILLRYFTGSYPISRKKFPSPSFPTYGKIVLSCDLKIIIMQCNIDIIAWH